jgi:hypothetical protein
MWSVWALLVLALVVLYVYRSRLTRDEDDQLILDDSFDHVKAEQAAIVAKVNKLEPVVRTTMILTAVMTVAVIAYYIVDFMRQFK